METDVPHVTTKKATTYIDIVMSRWEINPRTEELIVVETQVGRNIMAAIGECIRGGGSVDVRTRLTEVWNMPHNGRTVLLLDAALYHANPEYLALPHGEIAF